MFGGFFAILGVMGLLMLIILAAHPAQLGSEMKNFFFGNFKTASSVVTLVVVLVLAVFYVKSTSLKISQNQLVLTSFAAAGLRLDINQITKISYSTTPAQQKYTLTIGQNNYVIPFRVIDPNELTQSLKAINPNIQIAAIE